MRLFFKLRAIGAVVAAAATLTGPVVAQVVTNDVIFPRGSTGTTINSSIKGEQTRDFVVRARAGQVMSVRMTGSTNAYFNVLPPGDTGEAIHIGSVAGSAFAGTLSVSGPYRIRVYQMRATARRGETAAFRLAISVTGRGSSAASSAGGVGSISGIQGMDAIRAFDVLRERGFANVDSFSSGETLYGIYYHRPTRLCVQTTSAENRIVAIQDIKTHPKCR